MTGAGRVAILAVWVAGGAIAARWISNHRLVAALLGVALVAALVAAVVRLRRNPAPAGVTVQEDAELAQLAETEEAAVR